MQCNATIIRFILCLSRRGTMKVLIVIICTAVIYPITCDSEYRRYYDEEYPPAINYFPNDGDPENQLGEFLNFAVKIGIKEKSIHMINSDDSDKNNVSTIVNKASKLLKHNKNMIVVNLKIPGKDTIEERLRDRDVYEKQDRNQANSLIWIFHCDDNNINDEKCFGNDYKIVSRNILEYKPLWEFVTMGITILDRKILVCIPKQFYTDQYDALQASVPDSYMVISIEHCDENTQISNYLAIIADKPVMSDTDVPTIFYGTPYELPETNDYFPNSLSLSVPWSPLKYAFVSFLKKMEWYRVAIVSDDSEYSEAFLDELLPLFRAENIVFTAQSCDGKQCDFKKVFERLIDGKARIIILNLDSARHADRIVNAMENYRLKSMKWIVRDWPFQKNQPPWDVYSITLLPQCENAPYSCTISESLRIIHKIHQSVLSDSELFRKEFVHLFSQQKRQQRKTIARVHHHRRGRRPADVADIRILKSDAKIISFSLQEPVVLDVVERCIVKSGDFFNPCAHDTLLLLLVVCIMFALTMLIIVVYFNAYRTQRCYNRLR